MAQAKLLVSFNLSDKYLIGNILLMGDKYLICNTEVVPTDHSDKYLIGLSQGIGSKSFRQILDLRQILYWRHISLNKLKY